MVKGCGAELLEKVKAAAEDILFLGDPVYVVLPHVAHVHLVLPQIHLEEQVTVPLQEGLVGLHKAHGLSPGDGFRGQVVGGAQPSIIPAFPPGLLVVRL